MNRSPLRRFFLICLIGLSCWLGSCNNTATLDLSLPTSASDIYQYRPLHDPDGIGKFYFDREIAEVMGHYGAGWLERPTREIEENPSALIDALALKPTDVVADVGAGTGYFSFRISPRVPQGKVYAVDIQPQMLEMINFVKQTEAIENVEAIAGTETDPNLPQNSVDLVLMVDAYHEFVNPKEMMAGIVRSLKPDGKVFLVEYKAENPLVMIKRLHKMSQRQAIEEMAAIGLAWQETQEILPSQHLMIFKKNSQPIDADKFGQPLGVDDASIATP